MGIQLTKQNKYIKKIRKRVNRLKKISKIKQSKLDVNKYLERHRYVDKNDYQE